MRRHIAFLLAFLPFAAVPANADETVSLKVGFTSMQADGQFAGNQGVAGTNIDVKNDLGFGRSNNVTAEAALQFGDSRLSVGYLPLRFSGSSVLTRTLVFNNVAYGIGMPMDSRLQADIFDFGYTYYLINMNDLPSRLQIGIEAAVKITKAEASLTDRTTGLQRTASGTAPIPTLGVRARAGLSDLVAVNGRIGYLGYARNHFLDADAQVELSPIPMLGVYGGYRYLDLKLDKTGASVSTRMAGPYAGGFVRF